MNYDPFEIFQPPKSLIIDCIKLFKGQQKVLLQEMRDLRQTVGNVFVDEKLSTLNALTHKVRRYQMYLDGAQLSNAGEIAKQNAKARPIADFFPGKLRRAGKLLKGKCPFHSEKSPSFVIYPNNRYFCFGCLANGDSIDFVVKLNQISFPEAIRLMQ